MKTYSKLGTLFATLLVIIISISLAPPATYIAFAKPPTATPTSSGGATATPTSGPTATPGAAATYYVDCSAASNGTGTSASPWNSLTSPNAHTFVPGDSLLFKRGTTCNGELIPQGSGNASAVITIADYSTGALPILDGGTTNAATILLSDVEYYDLKNLAVRGSNKFAVDITGNTATKALHHFHVIGLDISAVNYVAQTRSDSGLLWVFPNVKGETINDVLVDGVTAHDSTAGDGISIGLGNDWPCGACGSGATVQNSVAHDVAGDGIVIYELSNGLMQNNVAYNSGKCTTCSGSTPVGLWTWNTNTTTAQFNESYLNHTWNGDGGGYDIDGDNVNNTYQYNYAHDNDGYCMAIYDFGSAAITQNAVFRYNVCANNVQKVTYGEIKIADWQGGALDTIQLYNNTFYYNPAPISLGNETEVVNANASYTGNSFFDNNVIYSLQPKMIRIGTGAMTFDYNLYYSPPGVGYLFSRLSTGYTSLSAWQAGTGNDLHSISADPLLNGVGYHGVAMPNLTNGDYTLQTGSPAIGAGTNVCAVSCAGGSMGTRDYFGQALGSTHNMGAED